MNKPVAWMVAEMVFTIEESAIEMAKVYEDEIIPLYTHPVKELTDSEIRTIQDMCHLKNVGYNNFIMRFARAILRKAQEK